MEYLIEQLQDKTNECNTTEYYLLQAEKYIKQGETDKGKACLILVTRCVSNYEESIEWNGLTDVWEQYKRLVDGLVEPSVRTVAPQPLSPDACTMSIGEILNGSDDTMLSDLSTHIGELSGNGYALEYLNRWERTFYYADELCMEVNSGGFEGYLYYHGTHFSKACQAFEQLGAEKMVHLTEQIRRKFPRGRVPKSEEAIQNAMDKLEDSGVDFEDEDEIYYSSAEKELLEKMNEFVTTNRVHFR